MKVRVTELAGLPRDRGVKVIVDGRAIALFRIEDDVSAIDDLCSHADASLSEGEVCDGAVECPRHGSEFDLKTGAPLSLPATAPVAAYETVVENGDVFVLMEDS